MRATMASCFGRPFVQRNSNRHSETYKTSYDRSHLYENVNDQSFVNSRVKRKIRDELTVQDPVVLKTYETVNKSTFSQTWRTYNAKAFYPQTTLVSRYTLKDLHENYVANPPRPIKYGSTTSGSTYTIPKNQHEIQTWSGTSRTEQFTSPISTPYKGITSIFPNESCYAKHLDPYITTTQLKHCNFDENQQNGVARKNIITFYDTIDLPKNRGFGPKKLEPFGSYFQQNSAISYKVHHEAVRSVPFFGLTSTYDSYYDFTPTHLMNLEDEITYPGNYKTTDVPNYHTENSQKKT